MKNSKFEKIVRVKLFANVFGCKMSTSLVESSSVELVLNNLPLPIIAEIGLCDIATHWALVRTFRPYWLYLREYPQLIHRLAQWRELYIGAFRFKCQVYMLGRWYYQTCDGGPTVIKADGELQWYWNNKIHRDGDQPAVICNNGDQEWYHMGKQHRVGAPASISADGKQEWLQDDVHHREDGPAIIEPDGTQNWLIWGQLHREDGPAVILPDGTQMWLWRDEMHREDGPAEICPGRYVKWYRHGVLHCDTGPAVIYLAPGENWPTDTFDMSRAEWWENGVKINPK